MIVRSGWNQEFGRINAAGEWGINWSSHAAINMAFEDAFHLGFNTSGVGSSYNYSNRHRAFPLRCLVR